MPPPNAPKNPFLIVALGASAGGLEAFQKFFTHQPANANMAFVVVQHLAPDHSSALADLLARYTDMPVAQAGNRVAIAPGRVYVIPPNATLTVKERTLHVALPAQSRGHRTPIDSAFSSLAEDCGEYAVCVLLSGTGSDGTIGLRAIKEFGGIAIAQSPATAKYDAIVQSAIATGLVDHVMPVEDMPAKIEEYAAYLQSSNGKDADGLAANLHRIHAILRRKSGHDFSEYKERTILRRIHRRVKALQLETVQKYPEFLESDPEEADRLFKDLLIGVTEFFRDTESFEALHRDVIPKLFDGKTGDDRVRVGVVGCASGEEAYSIAILLSEHAATLADPPKLQIFATDIDERGLEVARKGFYTATIAGQVTPERLEKFFHRQDGGYQVKRELREMVLFSSHSFIRDPPFSRLDLISCRNLMIYLAPELQRKIAPLFHYALRSGGYLFVGSSEDLTQHRDLFSTVNKKARIFQKKENVLRPAVHFPLSDFGPKRFAAPPRRQGEQRDPARQFEQLLLRRYGPACAVVQENGDAVYFAGRIGRYLDHPTGSPDSNVINVIREGLRIPLRTCLHKAATTGELAAQQEISVQINGGISAVNLTVEPFKEFRDGSLYLILIEEPPRDAGAALPATVADHSSDEVIRHLESELRSSQEHTQAVLEELESSNEELKSANEEFQSTNEELETSKEELQSFNEELETVNSELSRKVAELDHSNSDLQNLLNSTHIATVFLDLQLRVRSFTPEAGIAFRLIPGDIGRPITDLAARFATESLADELHRVIASLHTRERSVTFSDGRHFLMRMMPYRTIRNVIDGVVLAFLDVTDLKAAQLSAQAVIDTVREPLVVLDAAFRVVSASKAFYRIFRASQEETIGQSFFALRNRQWNIPGLRLLLSEILPAKTTVEAYEVVHDFEDIGRRVLLINARALVALTGVEPTILLGIEDVTERKKGDENRGRLAAIVESSADAIVGKSLDGVITSWNRGAQVMFGYTEEEALGQPVTMLIPPDRMEEEQIILDRVRNGRFVDNFETVRLRKDGSHLDISLTVSPIFDEQGKAVGASKIARDITETKRTQRLLESLNVDLRQFAFAASHDLQEPLRMVTSFTQLLAKRYRGKLDAEADQYIDYAVEGAERMESLLRDLRQYFSVNERKVDNPVPVDLNRLMEGLIAQLRVDIQAAGAKVTRDSLPTVKAEEVPLLLLFQNLLGNALKYRSSGKTPRIHVSAAKAGSEWKISVEDNGIGMDKQYLEQIFEPFKRLHSSEFPGTGMGLAMCRKIAERYGGRIWAESALGEGSTFHLTLPE